VTLAAAIEPRTRRVSAVLRFRETAGRTWIAEQRTPHPFHVTRPFRVEGDPSGMATLYLQSSSGGLYGDDDLSLAITAEAGAAAHVTTQASAVVHHARGGETRQRVTLQAGEGALLEFCPDPAILFAGARLRQSVRARVGAGARMILTDAALAHDPDGGAAPFDRLISEIAVTETGGRALLIDRAEVAGADWAARTAGRPCVGTVVVAGGDPAAVAEALRAALETGAEDETYAGVSGFPERGVAVARFLSADGAALTRALRAGWEAAREALTGAPAPARRK
jgi:urease accessory protein